MIATFGFIYAMPNHASLIKVRVLNLVPEKIKKVIELINLGNTLSFEELYELEIGYDDFDLWIKKTLYRWGFIDITKYRGLILIHKKGTKPDLEGIDNKLSELRFKTREQGLEFENNIKESLRELVKVLNEQGHKAAFINSVGNDKGQWIDGEIRIKMFNNFPDIRLLIEIKSYVAGVDQILEFLHKIRSFDGFIIPIFIAQAYTGIAYKYFASKVMLLKEKNLNEIKKMTETLPALKTIKI